MGVSAKQQPVNSSKNQKSKASVEITVVFSDNYL